jgi:hypothetical protein
VIVVARAVVACVVVSCLVSPRAAAEPKIADTPGGISKLLDDYGRAFEDRDASVLRRTTASGPFAERELKALANAADVPFTGFDVTATTRFSGNLASARIRKTYEGLEVATRHVIVETTFDVEDEPYVEDGAFTFAREAADLSDPYGGWRLVSKSDLDALGFFSPHFLWDEAPVAVQRSRHFLLLTHPEIADEMRPVLEVAESGLDAANAFWPRPSRERFTIIVPSTTAELGRIIRTTVDLGKFVAFVSAGVDRSEGWSPAQPRLYVHLSHLRNYNTGGQLEILTHELIHAVTRPASGPHMPTWVEEGIANLGGGSGGRRSRAREGPVPDDFPRDEEFVTGPLSEIQRRYDQGQVAIQVLIDRKGREAMARFYETLGKAREAAGTDRYLLEQAVERSLDWTIDDWIAEWRKALG